MLGCLAPSLSICANQFVVDDIHCQLEVIIRRRTVTHNKKPRFKRGSILI